MDFFGILTNLTMDDIKLKKIIFRNNLQYNLLVLLSDRKREKP